MQRLFKKSPHLWTSDRASLQVLLQMTLVGLFSTQSTQAQEGAKGQAVNVEVIQPASQKMVRSIMLPATLIADESVDLYAKTSGYVSTIDKNIGDTVSEGEALVVISVPEMKQEHRQAQAILQAKHATVKALQAKVAQAERNVETAKAQVRQHEARFELEQLNLSRKEDLRKGNAIPQQALDEARSAHAVTQAQFQIAQAEVAGADAELLAARADVEVAQADVAVAEANIARLETLMDYATVRAPFDGIISRRNVDHGTFVRSASEGAATSLLQILKVDRIRVVIEVPEGDTPYVRVGTPAMINVRALKGAPFTLPVSRIASAIMPETRTMRAEIDIEENQGRFAPGLYAQVTLELEVNASAMMIPSKALRSLEGETIVLVSAEGIAQSRTVEVGYDDGIWAEILSGLDGNDSVIAAASGTVAPGVRVHPVSVD